MRFILPQLVVKSRRSGRHKNTETGCVQQPQHELGRNVNHSGNVVTRIGTLHVVAYTQDWLDDQLSQWVELGAIVGEPPTVWSGPLSIDIALTGELLNLKSRRSLHRPARPRQCARSSARSAIERSSESSGLRFSRR
jgi:hypothetical protein